MNGSEDVKKVTREHLEEFGASGLRTLCLAYKGLSPEEYERWNEKFIEAKSSLRDREQKLDEVYLVYIGNYCYLQEEIWSFIWIIVVMIASF